MAEKKVSKTKAAEKSEKEVKAAATKKAAEGATSKTKSTSVKKTSAKAAEASEKTKAAKTETKTTKAATAKKSASEAEEKKTTTKTTTTAAAKKTTKASESKTTKAATSTRKAATTRTKKAAAKTAAEDVASTQVVEEVLEAPAPTEVREHFVETLHAVPPPPPQRDVPAEYGDTKVVLLVRDPEWVFAYWELNDETRARYGIPRSGHSKRLVLRVYNVTGRRWPEENAQYFFDIDVGPYANNWYIRVPESDAAWVAELGIFEETGEYVPIVASNVVRTPRAGMSPETDEQWMVIEETFRKLYESSGGFRIRDGWRGSEELWRHIEKHVGPALAGGAQLGGSAGMPGSGGVAAAKAPSVPSAFWLQAETELILYGATEPTAQVTVNDEPVALRPDGSFTLRYALPDGTLTLRVKAVSADGKHERLIVKEIRKLTR